MPGYQPLDQVAQAIRELETFKTMRGKQAPGQTDDSDDLLSRAKAKQAELKASGGRGASTEGCCCHGSSCCLPFRESCRRGARRRPLWQSCCSHAAGEAGGCQVSGTHVSDEGCFSKESPTMANLRRAALRTAAAALVAVGLFGLIARDAAAAERKSNIITLGTIEIVGRVQKPIESVDVGMIAPKLTLAELRQPFIDRIEEAVRHDPF